jgi:hypothetical protein
MRTFLAWLADLPERFLPLVFLVTAGAIGLAGHQILCVYLLALWFVLMLAEIFTAPAIPEDGEGENWTDEECAP